MATPRGSQQEISDEMNKYLMETDKSTLPDYVDPRHLLQFDGNFESGNLDSAYLSRPSEYNLLLKVDTNTKGNTHWFYFKVLNWQPKANVTFNIVNISRDMSRFYNKGMRIITRTESSDGKLKSPWVYDACTVDEYGPNEIVRTWRKDDPDVPARYYNTLKFSYKFPAGDKVNFDYLHNNVEEGTFDDFLGTVICFGYGLPYTYSDLLSDFQNAKKFLVMNGGSFLVPSQPKVQRQKSLDVNENEITKGEKLPATSTNNSLQVGVADPGMTSRMNSPRGSQPIT